MNSHDRSTDTRDGLDRRTAGSRDTRASIADALDRCRDELTRRVARTLAEPALDADRYLREPVAEFTTLAARENIPPERALVMFKKMVGGMADLRDLHPDQRADLHRRLIEIAIASYYEQARGAQRLAIRREGEKDTGAP